MSIELKPCPFCGSNAEGSEWVNDGQTVRYAGIRCDCGAEMSRIVNWWEEETQSTIKAAAKAWNRRYPDATKDAEIARLRGYLKQIKLIGGNLSDDVLCTATGANDARQRGGLVCLARDLARAALSPIPDPAGGMPVEVET